WSAALDQLASHSGLDEDEDEDRARRLFIVAAGNVPDGASHGEMSDPDEHPVEDPGQSWNALTIGGSTDLTEIAEHDLAGWTPFAAAGEKSPYSRCSTDWRQGRSPIKPELVLEAGNRAVSPSQGEISSGVDSLSVLTTRNDAGGRLLDTMWATSASAAQAAAMAGAITAENENFWPETVRALLVHSARWTVAMRHRLEMETKSERYRLLRQFGYGVPDLERALRSARSDVALISQSTIRPYCKRPNRGASFKECHVYELPWPLGRLEELGNREVELKVTLSYFIEPAPGQLAPIRPDRYRSAGLRFDLKRTGEPFHEFLARKNRLDQDGEDDIGAYTDTRWLLDQRTGSVGSLHTNTWIGPAAELLDRNALVVYPVMGWWRDRASLGKIDSDLPYSLVISLRSSDASVDIYSEIETAIGIALEAAEIQT
ncbi:MAG TPA: S8 family serine peptidase, partial [Allosphingosinicella sp.]|nr:S8 family serine peptidase [Allosphingosinicella sp.]